MKVILGIGNPGLEYQKTRHNIGFRVVDKLAQSQSWTKQFHSLTTDLQINDVRVLLVKPLTYVNLSGQTAKAVLDYYKLPLESLLVVVDDVSLPLGKLRLRPKGSSGGHKGMISLIDSLSSDLFPRLRIGISKDANQSLSSYVLSKFSQEEEKILENVFSIAESACTIWLQKGIDAAMNFVNGTAIDSLDEA